MPSCAERVNVLLNKVTTKWVTSVNGRLTWQLYINMSNRVQFISSHVHCKRIIRQFPLKLNSPKDYSWTQEFTLHAIKYYGNHGKLQQYYSPFIEHDHMYWYIMKKKWTTRHNTTQRDNNKTAWGTTCKGHMQWTKF